MPLSPNFDWDALRGIDWADPVFDAPPTTTATEADEEEVPFSLSPEDVLYFQGLTDDAYEKYGPGGSAEIGFNLQRSRLSTDYGRDLVTGESLGGGLFGDLRDTYKDGRERLVQPLAQRGVLRSGIMTDAVNRFFRTKNRAFEQLETNFARTATDLNLEQEGLGGQLERSLADIQNDKGLRRSVFASMIGEQQ